MRLSYLILVAVGGSAILLPFRQARAELITFSFEGQITELLGDVGFLGGSVPVGAAFSGSYTFDSNTPDSVPLPELAEYENTLTAFTLYLGNHVLVGSGLQDQIQVWNNLDQEGDLYYVQDATPYLLARQAVCTFILSDSTGTSFSNDELPILPPDLLSFDDRKFQIGGPAGSFFIVGTVSTLVPEPKTLVLLGISALSLHMAKRNRSGGSPTAST